ncbi:MAG TPA: PhoH family protein [Candidatus Hydrogenedentes bacterium]|nr:PhoH family protein [Candidatus Hydrogenedentota bacterium]
MGRNGELRRRIQDEAQVRIVDRGAKVVIVGEERDAHMVRGLLRDMLAAVRSGHVPTLSDLNYALAAARDRSVHNGGSEVISERSPGIREDIHIRPRTHGQKHYLETILSCPMTLVIGPAGTGKTYLAMAAAVSSLLNKQVKRLVLTRPAVEAGESLGFLPGGLEEKVNPYLRPLYDALYSMVDMARVRRFMDEERVEVAPLAFMRGRTLEQAFVILDEAQNTTSEQMLMFLTRLGEGSRAVITGDITQIDLPKGTKSGLVEARRILRGVPEIGLVHLSKHDVVRHPLVQRIVDAYESDTVQTVDSEVKHSGSAIGA